MYLDTQEQIGFIIEEKSGLDLILQELVYIDSGIVIAHSWDSCEKLVESGSLNQLYIEYSAVKNALALCEEIRTKYSDLGVVLFCEYQDISNILKSDEPCVDWFLIKPVGVRQIIFTIRSLSKIQNNRKTKKQLSKDLEFARNRLEELVTLVDQKYPGGLEALSSSNDTPQASPNHVGIEKRYTQVQKNITREEEKNKN